MRSIVMVILLALPALAQAPAAADDRYVITSLGRTVRLAESELKAVSRVEPMPPRRALQRGTKGEVVVEVLVDTAGNVTEAKVVKGLPDGLDAASVAAVRKWKFEPYLEDGQPVPVSSRVTIGYNVSRTPAEAAQSVITTSLGPTVRIADLRHASEVLKRVNPTFPEEARRAGVSGTVMLEVLIDASGDVAEVKVLNGLPHGLTESTVTAVRQWKYKPFARDGKAWPVLAPVAVSFKNR